LKLGFLFVWLISHGRKYCWLIYEAFSCVPLRKMVPLCSYCATKKLKLTCVPWHFYFLSYKPFRPYLTLTVANKVTKWLKCPQVREAEIKFCFPLCHSFDNLVSALILN
jgi:hypothetical protein